MMNEVLRQEKKYLISLDQYYRISRRFEKIMMQDPHNGEDGYCIRSLYLIPLMIVIFKKKKMELKYAVSFG